jgi:hypothetical protein
MIPHRREDRKMIVDETGEPIPNSGLIHYVHMKCQFCGTYAAIYDPIGIRRKSLKGYAKQDKCTCCGMSTARKAQIRRMAAC